MKQIWRFPLGIVDAQNVDMPEGARILTVQQQGACLCLWAIVDPDAAPRPRRILIAGTGHPCFDGLRYISTAQTAAGRLVWHVFEPEDA